MMDRLAYWLIGGFIAFVRRHPVATSVIVLLLLILPPFLSILSGVFITANAWMTALNISAGVRRAVNRVLKFVADAKENRPTIFALAIAFAMAAVPVAGWFTAIYLLFDRWKVPATYSGAIET